MSGSFEPVSGLHFFGISAHLLLYTFSLGIVIILSLLEVGLLYYIINQLPICVPVTFVYRTKRFMFMKMSNGIFVPKYINGILLHTKFEGVIIRMLVFDRTTNQIS